MDRTLGTVQGSDYLCIVDSDCADLSQVAWIRVQQYTYPLILHRLSLFRPARLLPIHHALMEPLLEVEQSDIISWATHTTTVFRPFPLHINREAQHRLMQCVRAVQVGYIVQLLQRNEAFPHRIIEGSQSWCVIV